MVNTNQKNQIACALSIVVPVFNEENVIPLLALALNAISSQFPKQTELLLINDGSKDKTSEIIQKTEWPFPVTLIELSRNFGHQSALFAGLKAAKGRAVVTMDADLQHPPTLIPELFLLFKQGYDIVLTQRKDTIDKVSLYKRTTSKLFYSLINKISNTQIPTNTSDFRLMSRKALDALLQMPEYRKFLRGMVNWIGFKSIIVPFNVDKRVAGKSKYSVSKMFQLAFYGVTSFSVLPLYFSGIFSIVLFILAFIYALYVLYAYFIAQVTVSGWASLLFVILVIGGFLSLFLGLIGFYLAAIYDEVKQRPTFIIKDQFKI